MSLLSLDKYEEKGSVSSCAIAKATLDPDIKNPLHAPNTEIIIPTAIIFPPMFPNSLIATAAAGAFKKASDEAGITFK